MKNRYTKKTLVALSRPKLIALAIRSKVCTAAGASKYKRAVLIDLIRAVPTAPPTAVVALVALPTPPVVVAQPEPVAVAAAPVERPTAVAVADSPADGDNVVAFPVPEIEQTEFKAATKQTDGGTNGIFKVNRKGLQRCLATVARAARGRTNTMPILQNVLLSFGDQRLHVEATNLDLYVATVTDAETSGEFELAVPFTVLSNFAAKCTSEFLMAEVKGHTLHLSDLDGNRTNILGLSKEEWPPMPANKDATLAFEISGKSLSRVITETQKCASTDETRYILNGLFFNLKEQVVIATDGRRLVRVPLTADAVPRPADKDGKAVTFILPALAAEQLRATLPSDAAVKIAVGERAITVRADAGTFGYTVYAKVVEGNYPNYVQVIPREEPRGKFEVARVAFIEALGRVEVITSEKSNSVKLTFTKNHLKITGQSPDRGEGKEEMEIKGDGAIEPPLVFDDTTRQEIKNPKAGEPCALRVAFNPRFLIEIASSWTDDNLTIHVQNEASPCVLLAGAKLAVVMPVRLS